MRSKPKPPLGRFIREGDCGPFCGVCGSSFRLRWLSLGRVGVLILCVLILCVLILG